MSDPKPPNDDSSPAAPPPDETVATQTPTNGTGTADPAPPRPATPDTSNRPDQPTATESATEPAADGPAVEDTVAANVDAPAQTPGTGNPTPPQPARPNSPDQSTDTGSGTGTVAAPDGPAVGDTVAANVDAPAQTPGTDTANCTPPAGTGMPDDETVVVKDGDAVKKDGDAGSGDGTAPPAAGGDTAGDGDGGQTPGVVRKRRNPWPTVGTLVAVLVILAGIGYFGGLGPLNRLSTTRDLNPPAQLSGLNRITDPVTRERLQLDQTRDALRRINDGKKATVEAYGEPTGDKLFMVIALRGKVDIDKEIRDSGATGDQVKKIGKSTCATSVQDIPTSCYRGSNTLTVIAQGLNDKADVESVADIADEAFDAMK
jgi:hypothetical protein